MYKFLPLNFKYVKLIDGKKSISTLKSEYYSTSNFKYQKYYKSIIKL
jgi:hypothetical protein